VASRKRKPELQPLIPPDLERCQAEVPNDNSFMTLGGRPGHVQCPNRPIVIAYEVAPGEDGRIGSMSLCGRCMGVMQKQMPGHCRFEGIDNPEVIDG
jgi:hypothetical protein